MPIVVLPRFDFRAFLQSIQDFRISTLFLVPPQIILLVKQDIVKEYDLSSVKMAMAGAAPLTNDVSKFSLTLSLPALSLDIAHVRR